ncbi:MAG: 50S ribosomal protein L28 [Candidatus Levybacteria bacterium]|nr:50S ribosomal protein L28 [Candidatus Levybacteria bacterium]
MGKKCENCGKGVMYGHNVSHSKRRTKRTFEPNLHEARVLVGSTYKRMKLCTKCLRMYKKLEALKTHRPKDDQPLAGKVAQAAV